MDKITTKFNYLINMKASAMQGKLKRKLKGNNQFQPQFTTSVLFATFSINAKLDTFVLKHVPGMAIICWSFNQDFRNRVVLFQCQNIHLTILII